METQELTLKIKSGDPGAFRQLIDEYQSMVVNTAIGMVHNVHDAEDIAQEVFIEVYRSIGNFRGEASLKTWIYRITVTRTLNFIRNQKKHRWMQSIHDFFNGERSLEKVSEDYRDRPDFSMEEQQKADLLYRAIDSLPENQRIAFTLNKYEDLSYKEIAEIMDLSLSSVESLLHRAKKNLQKKLLDCYKKSR